MKVKLLCYHSLISVLYLLFDFERFKLTLYITQKPYVCDAWMFFSLLTLCSLQVLLARLLRCLTRESGAVPTSGLKLALESTFTHKTHTHVVPFHAPQDITSFTLDVICIWKCKVSQKFVIVIAANAAFRSILYIFKIMAHVPRYIPNSFTYWSFWISCASRVMEIDDVPSTTRGF